MEADVEDEINDDDNDDDDDDDDDDDAVVTLKYCDSKRGPTFSLEAL